MNFFLEVEAVVIEHQQPFREDEQCLILRKNEAIQDLFYSIEGLVDLVVLLRTPLSLDAIPSELDQFWDWQLPVLPGKDGQEGV